MRYAPSHFPATMCDVESGVHINKSRLPRARSSASELAAATPSRSNPIARLNALTKAANPASLHRIATKLKTSESVT